MSRNFLSEILAQKRETVARMKAKPSSNRLREHALEIRKTAGPHRLLQALKSESPKLKIIAEFKRKSPSAGILRDDLSAAEVARSYERGGACAISVLTDEAHFGGSIGDLRDIAEDQLGLDALVEVHTSEELHRALNAGAKIIGVNNRNLQTFQVSLETSERLIAEAEDDKIMISESGLQDAESLRRLDMLGFNGFLIGETLMRATNAEKALRDLIHAASEMDGAQRRGYTSFGLRH